MAGPPVYEDALFELSIDPSYNSLDNSFKHALWSEVGVPLISFANKQTVEEGATIGTIALVYWQLHSSLYTDAVQVLRQAPSVQEKLIGSEAPNMCENSIV